MMFRLPIALAVVAGATIACVSRSPWTAEVRNAVPVRPASDVPLRFDPRDRSLRIRGGDTLAGPGCLSPMIDPRDRAELRFVFSTSYGDYEVPPGRYGARANELLRLECNTGRVIGLVPR